MKIASQKEVPEFCIEFQKEKKNLYAVCVFVINEGEKVRKQLRAMQSHAHEVDIIIADGGSTDGSFDGGILEKTSVTALLVKTGPGKLSAQMRMGLSWCMDQGYEGVITIDGNGKDGIESITRFIELLKQGYDHIQGSRFIKGGFHQNTPAARYWGVKLIHSPLISLASGFRYTDTTNGFRGYSRKMLLHEKVLPFRECFQTYEIHYYLAIRAARLKLKCIETPVSRSYPNGKVPTKIVGIKGNIKIFKILLKAVIGYYNPQTVNK